MIVFSLLARCLLAGLASGTSTSILSKHSVSCGVGMGCMHALRAACCDLALHLCPCRNMQSQQRCSGAAASQAAQQTDGKGVFRGLAAGFLATSQLLCERGWSAGIPALHLSSTHAGVKGNRLCMVSCPNIQ